MVGSGLEHSRWTSFQATTALFTGWISFTLLELFRWYYHHGIDGELACRPLAGVQGAMGDHVHRRLDSRFYIYPRG